MITTATSDDRAFGANFLGQIIDWIVEHFEPEEIYPEAVLIAWAEYNGYVKEE